MQRDEFAEDLAGDEEAQCCNQADAKGRQGDGALLLGDIHARHHLAVTGQGRIAIAQAVEQAGDDDREDVTERQRRNQDRNVVACRLAQQLLVDLAHRYRASPHAATHDRHSDDHDCVLRREAQQGADGHREQSGEQHRAEQRQRVARTDFDQHLGVHTQDAAGDQCCDVEVEKAAALHEAGDVIGDCGGQPAEIDHGCCTEQRHDGAAAEIGLDDRQPVAGETEQLAEEHHHQQRTDHAGGQRVRGDGRGHDEQGDGKQRQRQIEDALGEQG